MSKMERVCPDPSFPHKLFTVNFPRHAKNLVNGRARDNARVRADLSRSAKGASTPSSSSNLAGEKRGKDVPERSQTSEHIAGITREERQKDRPSGSRGRRAGRRPEEGRRSGGTPSGRRGEEGRKKQRASGSSGTGEGPSRGVNDGSGNQGGGEGEGTNS